MTDTMPALGLLKAELRTVMAATAAFRDEARDDGHRTSYRVLSRLLLQMELCFYDAPVEIDSDDVTMLAAICNASVIRLRDIEDERPEAKGHADELAAIGNKINTFLRDARIAAADNVITLVQPTSKAHH